jgi:hypothetical protein
VLSTLKDYLKNGAVNFKSAPNKIKRKPAPLLDFPFFKDGFTGHYWPFLQNVRLTVMARMPPPMMKAP